MPRIPVYNQQMSYAVPTVRTVEVAGPVAKIPDLRARNLQNISEGITFVKNIPELRDKGWDTWQSLKPELQNPWGSIRTWWRNEKPRVDDEEPARPPEKKKPQTPKPPAPPQTPPAPDAPGKNNGQTAYLPAAMRRGLLEAASSGGSNKSPAAGLDEYAVKGWNRLSPDGAQRDAFAQDYAVLRREPGFGRSNPFRRAIQTKLGRERAFFRPNGVGDPYAAGVWIIPGRPGCPFGAGSRRGGLMRKTAVRQFKENAGLGNVETALAAREPASARAVYRAHGSLLPPKRRAVLEEKIACAEAEDAGYALWKRAQEELEDPSEENVRRFVREETPGTDTTFQSRAAAYAGRCAQKEARQKARLQSESFRSLRQAENPDGAARALWSGYTQDAADLERKRKAVESVFSEPSRASDPAVFNRLYRALQGGEMDQKTLDKGFAEGTVNGRDYLLLNERLSARQSGQTDAEEGLLHMAVERFCRKKELSGQDAEVVKYRIYASPGTAQERLAELGRVKEWLID